MVRFHTPLFYLEAISQMPHENDWAGKVDKSNENQHMVFRPDKDFLEVEQPRN